MTPGKNYTNHILVAFLIVASFLIGTLYTKVTYLEKGVGTNTAGAQTNAGTTAGTQVAPSVDINKVKEAFDNSLVKIGKSDSKVVFLEIADPSCPYCHAAAGHNPELNKQMGAQFTLVSDGGTYVAPVIEMKKLVDSGQAAFAWLYFPGHGSGEMGTKAMYCAHEAGKFWEVHDKLMTNEGYTLLNDTIKNDKTKAKELADFFSAVFDPGEMQKCLDGGKYDEQLQKDMKAATGLGVNGTPGFFVNATNYAGAYNYNDMKSSVESALN